MLPRRCHRRRHQTAPTSSIARPFKRLLADQLARVRGADCDRRVAVTHFCWLDFDRRFHVAHTAARQTRCSALDGDNGAVNWEALLRNVRWASWDASFGGATGTFTVEVVAGVLQFPNLGRDWLMSVQDVFVDVATEAAYWRSKRVTRWQLRWHNEWQPDVDETLALIKAIGMTQCVAIKHIAYMPQTSGATAAALGASLIRNVPNRTFPEQAMSAKANVLATRAAFAATSSATTPALSTDQLCVDPNRIACASSVASISALPLPSVPHSAIGAVQADTTAVSIFQFAVDSNDTVLTQPPLDAHDHPWSFFGWILLDWALQTREVRKSSASTATSAAPRAYRNSTTPTRSRPTKWPCRGALASLSPSSQLPSRCFSPSSRRSCASTAPPHAFVSSVGRLFLLLRGLSAITLLATPSVQFVASGGTHVQAAPRPATAVFVVTLEATWVAVVLNELVAPFVAGHSYVAVPAATLVGWLSLVGVEVAWPVQATLALARTCTTVTMAKQVVCTSGVLQFGSPARVCLVLVVQAVATAAVYLVAVMRSWRRDAAHVDRIRSVLGQHACHRRRRKRSSPSRQPKQSFFVDLKAWVVLQEAVADDGTLPPRRHSCSFRAPMFSPGATTKTHAMLVASVAFHRMDALMALCWVVYMLVSLSGSVMYIAATNVNIANDLWWSHFNVTGALAFLGNWYTLRLVVDPTGFDGTLDGPAYADATPYNTSSTVVSSSPLYPRVVQTEAVSGLETAIQGLRATPFCLIPEITTLAGFSATQHYVANAVYLEALMRNALADRQTLRTMHDGRAWLDGVRRSPPSVQGEVALWRAYGIGHFTTQIQNVRQVGLFETYGIQNAFGVNYAMTLKLSKGAQTMTAQTSLKWHWSLHMDLWLVTMPTSPLINCSLLPSSPTYVFANTSRQAVLRDTEVINMPFPSTYAALQIALGPFGSIDAWRIPTPESLRRYFSAVSIVVSTLVATNDAAKIAYSNLALPYLWTPCPIHWIGVVRRRQILCPDNAVTSSTTMFSLWTDGECHSVAETIYPTRKSSLAAYFAASSTTTTTMATSCGSVAQANRCKLVLAQLQNMTMTFVAPSDVAAMVALADAARVDVLALNVLGSTKIDAESLLQFRVDFGAAKQVYSYAIGATPLVRPLFSDTTFAYFSWSLALK
ncbi:Aste57867_16217 [Aphanomyces stellatus]|uniref:Aste57867_16217 protein n=1 Tax=Aphanomyces stellatus TaxID=120398 RepID=A0A485L5X0_9STRA|nr:hypothetical protein As57867_016160 [Aphanomyces stellatus]VFT92995.1 Aste57867_16217 [Aphanomyces stellatus]